MSPKLILLPFLFCLGACKSSTKAQLYEDPGQIEQESPDTDLPLDLTPRHGVNIPYLVEQMLGLGSGSDGSPQAAQVIKKMAYKAVADAAYSGAKLVRLSATSWGPVTFQSTNLHSLKIWQSDPERYFAAAKEALDLLHRYQLKAVLTVVWSIESFAALYQKNILELIRDPQSIPSQQQKLFVQQLVSRFKNHPALLMWEFHNEMSLFADLNFEKYCLKQWKDYIRSEADRLNYCGVAGSFTTAEMITYQTRLAAEIREIDSKHLISTGNAIPRFFAEHWRASPDFPPGQNDRRSDSKAEFIKNLLETNAMADVLSVHFYNSEDSTKKYRPYLTSSDLESTELLEVLQEASALSGKMLFLGEFFEGSTPPALRRQAPFSQKMLQKMQQLRTAFSALWAWEFYQFNTYDHQQVGENSFAIEAGYNVELLQRLFEINVSFGHSFNLAQPLQFLISWPWPEMSLNAQAFQAASFVHVLASAAHPFSVEVFLNGNSLGQKTSMPYRFPVLYNQIEEHNTIEVRVTDSSGTVHILKQNH